MKTYIAVLLIGFIAAEAACAQNINWRSLKEDQRNAMQLNLGYDYGMTAQLGYSRSLTIIRPVVLGLDYTSPMGNDLLDDFKVRLGAQIELVEIDGFSATAKIFSNFRRYQTDLVRIVSFGSDFAGVAGYYSATWYAAGEFGFDKAVTSYLKHSDVMRAMFPAIRDGWYVPTGGHFYYGIQGGKTLGENLELSLRAGATDAQFKDEEAVLPYYLQLGLGVRF